MTDRFDFNEALKAIQSGQAMSGKDSVLAQHYRFQFHLPGWFAALPVS